MPCPRKCTADHCSGPRYAAEKREYIFASRDRIDNTFDRVRTVRDARYKYIYNFRPELPYLQWMPYADLANPVNELMRKLTSEGRLSDNQAKLCAGLRGLGKSCMI